MATLKMLTAPPLQAHAQNDVPVKLKADLSTAILATIRLVVLRIVAQNGNETAEYRLSTRHVAGGAGFDLSTALQFLFENIEQQTTATSEPVLLKESGYTFSYTLYASLYTLSGIYEAEEMLSFGDISTWYAVRAGLSDTVFASGFDAFADKHFSSTANYFLTTRTAGHTLATRENEQRLFWFLSKGNESFVFRNIHDQEVKVSYENTEFCCLVLDMDQIRSLFYYTYGHLPNVIDIERTGFAPVTFAITPSQGTKHLRVLEFRNGWEVWDKVELTGEMELNHAADGETYEKYYAPTAGFYNAVDRSKATLSFKGSSGYKTDAELRWLTDLLCSPEVYLVDRGSRFPVVVKRDSRTVGSDTFEPMALALEITYAIQDNRYTPVV
jgi:hypothetical protein